MKKLIFTLLIFSVFITLLQVSCRNDKVDPEFSGYPQEIGKIIFTKCATTGCHTASSKEAAGGLSMETWDQLFEGGHNGAAVIPYRSDYSSLCYFINTYSDLGVALTPTMPYGKTPLTHDEVLLFKQWIDAGAPDKNGFVKFSDNPTRKKYYVTNQGCDVVTVFDEASGLQMRFIDVGATAGIEAPHMVKVSPDGNYWYVLSLGGLYLEKYSTVDDHLIGRINIGSGYWNAFTISSDSHTAYCSDMTSGGKIEIADLAGMTATSVSPFNYPHGLALSPANDTLYITQQVGSSFLHKGCPLPDFSSTTNIDLYGGASPGPSLNPHEVALSPDGSKYFVTCQGDNTVRVFTVGTDSLQTIIPVGTSPTEMSFSTVTNYLFVSCTEDVTSTPGKRGSVAIIDYTTNSLVKLLYTGWQPHGIAVDDAKKICVVVNRNFATDGPAPHHSGECGGRNGYVTFIDMNTLELTKTPATSSDRKIEIAVDPYSVAVRK